MARSSMVKGGNWLCWSRRVVLYHRDRDQDGYPTCWACSSRLLPGELQLDHLIPGQRADPPYLLTVACQSCNSKRGNLPLAITLRLWGRRWGRDRVASIVKNLSRRHRPIAPIKEAQAWFKAWTEQADSRFLPIDLNLNKSTPCP